MGIELLLQMAADGHGDRTALGSTVDGFTYDALQRAARGLASVAAAHGASEIAMVGVIGPMLPVGLFGAAHAQVPFVPLNYRLAGAQLDELIDALDRPLVIADAEFVGQLRREGRLTMSTDEALSAAAHAEPLPPGFADDDSPAVILFTSGTTSRPKGVLLNHGNLSSYVFGTVEFGSAEADECQLIAVPPYHVAGVGSALTSTYVGRRVVYLPRFTPEAWLEAVRSERVTSAMVVPTMLARVMEHLNTAPGDAPTLRSLAYGGARMPRPVLERALEAFPDVAFTNAYGLTETSSTIAVLGPEDHRAALGSSDPDVTARLDSVGRAVPGVEIAIRGEDGTILPAGQVGEVLVRGPQVSGTYRGLGSALLADGWFPTRDSGWLDRDGYLFVLGRMDDTIIRGGENIAPAEIETVLVRHPAVRECAAIGLPDDEWGERIAAVVVLEPGAAVTPEDLREHVRGELRGSRTPDEVHFVDEMPYTPTGKLLRRVLVEQLTPVVT